MQQVLRHIIRVAATKPDACAPDAGSWIPGATAASAQKSVSGITCTSITHVQMGICQTSHFIGCHQTEIRSGTEGEIEGRGTGDGTGEGRRG